MYVLLCIHNYLYNLYICMYVYIYIYIYMSVCLCITAGDHGLAALFGWVFHNVTSCVAEATASSTAPGRTSTADYFPTAAGAGCLACGCLSVRAAQGATAATATAAATVAAIATIAAAAFATAFATTDEARDARWRQPRWPKRPSGQGTSKVAAKGSTSV